MNITSAQERYFEGVTIKNKLKDLVKKHQDFLYDEAQWIYEDETIDRMRKEIEKLQNRVDEHELALVDMRKNNAWTLEELAEMRKIYNRY